jgi:hypothetical protein
VPRRCVTPRRSSSLITTSVVRLLSRLAIGPALSTTRPTDVSAVPAIPLLRFGTAWIDHRRFIPLPWTARRIRGPATVVRTRVITTTIAVSTVTSVRIAAKGTTATVTNLPARAAILSEGTPATVTDFAARIPGSATVAVTTPCPIAVHVPTRAATVVVRL